MSTLPRGRSPLFLTLGLAAVGAIVAGFILFQSGKASEVDLTTAGLVPADAGFYVAINTDLSSEQWVAAFNLIERLGQDNPRGELEDAVDDVGQDWEKDVVPFLGGNAAFYLRSTNVSLFEQDGALIFKANDPEAALEVIEDGLGLDFDSDEYEGVEYFFAEDGFLYVTIIDGHIALATSEDAIFDIIDVSKGEESLADVQDFQRLRDELSKNFLLFVYIAPGSLMEDMLDSDNGLLRTAMEEAGVSDLALKPQAFVIGAKKNSFEAQNAALGAPGVIGPMTSARTSRFAKVVPGETTIFFSTQQLAQTYEKIIEDAGDEIDDALRENTEYRSLDEAFEDAGRELGLRSAEQIIAQLTGESAVAAWFPTGDEDEAEFVFLSELKDEGEAKNILASIMKASNLVPTTKQVNGKEMTTFVEPADFDDPGAYAVVDGYLVFGTEAAVEKVLGGGYVTLDQMQTYRETIAALPTKTGTYFYFDMAALLRLTEGGIPVDLSTAEKALRGAALNYVNERDVVRASGVLTIAE